MTQVELKNLIQHSADKPVRICLADGANYRVNHPDFAFTTADSLILASGPGHEIGAEFIVCPISHITRVEILKRNGKTRH